MAKKAIYGKYECVNNPTYTYAINQSIYPSADEIKRMLKNDSYQFISADIYNVTLYGGLKVANPTVRAVTLDTSKPIGQSYGKLSCCKLYESSYGDRFIIGTQDTDKENYVGLRVYAKYPVNDTRLTTTTTINNYSKGSYLTDIIADYNSLPANGKHTDGYWYVYIKMASDLKGNDTGIWRDIPTGWANVNGVWKPQSELKGNVSGIYK